MNSFQIYLLKCFSLTFTHVLKNKLKSLEICIYQLLGILSSIIFHKKFKKFTKLY